MDELIPITQRSIGTETIPTVDARDLHAFLGIAKDYNAWMRQQIKRVHLVENCDFVTYQQVGSPRGGRAMIDYYITFDVAKHIAMMSGSEKGYEVRAYFIACEKALHDQQQMHPRLHDPRMQILVEAVIRMDALEQQLVSTKENLLANQQATIAAQADALQAKDLAMRALEDQQWVTIHQYVVQHGLERQMPESAQRAYGTYLSGYCQERRLHVYKIGMLNGWDINTYHAGAIRDTIESWLVRQTAQQHLTLVQ